MIRDLKSTNHYNEHLINKLRFLFDFKLVCDALKQIPQCGRTPPCRPNGHDISRSLLILVSFLAIKSIRYHVGDGEVTVYVPLFNESLTTYNNNKHIEQTYNVLCEDCFYVAERSEQKPELSTKLGTTRETLQECRALRHGRIDIIHNFVIKRSSNTAVLLFRQLS